MAIHYIMYTFGSEANAHGEKVIGNSLEKVL